VPDPVIDRAKVLVEELSDADITYRAREIAENGTGSPSHRSPVIKPDELELGQLTLFDTVDEEGFARELQEMDLGKLTPIDALNTLYRWQAALNNRWKA